MDDEIKSYISAHKHELMSGMQDVAALATRYQELESTAQKLRNTIDKMQREVSSMALFPHPFRLMNLMNQSKVEHLS